VSDALKVEFRCPKCGAAPHKHGKGGNDSCKYGDRSGACEGLLCDCDPEEFPESEEKDHGTTFGNPCRNANCYHCNWGGVFPPKPKGLHSRGRRKRSRLGGRHHPPAQKS
jgi:hypothetical protein